MQSLIGNTVLLVDADSWYVGQVSKRLKKIEASCFSGLSLAEAQDQLKKYDVELVICNFDLPDGTIHDLIDWASKNLKVLPIFVALGKGEVGDQKLIADVWKKEEDHKQLVYNIYVHLFDYKKFRDSLQGLSESRGIKIEVIVNKQKYPVSPQEILPEGIFVISETPLEASSSVWMRLSVYTLDHFENFSILGAFEKGASGDLFFRINPAYSSTWNQIQLNLEERQNQVNDFMKKVKGF